MKYPHVIHRRNDLCHIHFAPITGAIIGDITRKDTYDHCGSYIEDSKGRILLVSGPIGKKIVIFPMEEEYGPYSTHNTKQGLFYVTNCNGIPQLVEFNSIKVMYLRSLPRIEMKIDGIQYRRIIIEEVNKNKATYVLKLRGHKKDMLTLNMEFGFDKLEKNQVLIVVFKKRNGRTFRVYSSVRLSPKRKQIIDVLKEIK